MNKIILKVLLIISISLSVVSCENPDNIGYHFRVFNASSYDINNIVFAPEGQDPETQGTWFNVNIPNGYAFLVEIQNSDFVSGNHQILIYYDHDNSKGWFWNTAGHYVNFVKDENAVIVVKDAIGDCYIDPSDSSTNILPSSVVVP